MFPRGHISVDLSQSLGNFPLEGPEGENCLEVSEDEGDIHGEVSQGAYG
jgi:hypothetical protein